MPNLLVHCFGRALVASLMLTCAEAADCPLDHAKLQAALRASVKPSGGQANGGFENHEWASVVSRDGTVCAVVFTGMAPTDQWPGSRLISVEKATTANAFSIKSMALATANLFALAQPGQSLFGITTARPPSSECRRCRTVRSAQRSNGRQAHWRRDRVRRRACALRWQRRCRRP